jgi:hypothetical protein
MKRIILFLLLIGFLIPRAEAQLRFGIRGGINKVEEDASPFTVINDAGNELLDVGLSHTSIGLIGGLVIRADIGKFIIQPELLISSQNYKYQVIDLNDPNVVTEVANEKYQYFSIPVMLGYKVGPLRLQTGPEAHIFVDNTSDLIDINFYKENIDDFTFGWVANIGLDIWNIMLDFRYEGNFAGFGSSFVVGNTTFQFDERPGRWVYSLGFLF